MANRNVRTRVLRGAMTLLVGGSAFQLSGCDPAVRDTLLNGLQQTTTSLSNALITAFFLSIQDDTTTGTTSGFTTT